MKAEIDDMSDYDTGEVSPVHLANDMRGALQTMRDTQFLLFKKYEEQQWRADRQNAHLLILEFEKAFVKEMAALGVPMFAHTVVRSRAVQRQVFKDGFSKTTGEKEYAHEHCAADIIHSKYGWNLTKEQWTLIGHVGKEVAQKRGIAIVWGGDWKQPYDPAHWELAQWRERAKEVLRGQEAAAKR